MELRDWDLLYKALHKEIGLQTYLISSFGVISPGTDYLASRKTRNTCVDGVATMLCNNKHQQYIALHLSLHPLYQGIRKLGDQDLRLIRRYSPCEGYATAPRRASACPDSSPSICFDIRNSLGAWWTFGSALAPGQSFARQRNEAG